MELRVLTYFLAIAREESISGAAEVLHLSQPTLSRQIMDLEEELGKKLLVRGNRKITLTEDGMLLRRRAEEILELVRRTEKEITLPESSLAGDVCVGAGETEAVRLLTRAARELQREHPDVHFHLSTGDGAQVREQLDKGLIDFGLVLDAVDLSKYNSLRLPIRDTWGLLMRTDDPLAAKPAICREDLPGVPLIMSKGALRIHALDDWLGDSERLRVSCTYSMPYNGSLMVEAGCGCAVSLDRILNLTGDSPLCFRPFEPPVRSELHLVWKKYQLLSRAGEKYLETLRAICEAHGEDTL